MQIQGGGSGIGTFAIQIAKAKGVRVLVTAGELQNLNNNGVCCRIIKFHGYVLLRSVSLSNDNAKKVTVVFIFVFHASKGLNFFLGRTALGPREGLTFDLAAFVT